MTTPFNRVKFTPATGGTGDFVVSAAVTGYNTPAQRGVLNNTSVSYTAESADKTQWETGIGTYQTSGTTLVRTTVRENSLGDTSIINFSAAPSVWFDWHAQEFTNYRHTDDIVITARAGVAGGTEGGGNINITGGDGAGDFGDGGFLELNAGFGGGAGDGGDLRHFAGSGDVAGAGGNIQINAGNGGSEEGDGGSFNIQGGDAVSGDGGNFLIVAGGSQLGAGGTIDFAAGSTTSGVGGTIILDAGTGTTGGGGFECAAGLCSGTDGNAGNFVFETKNGGSATGNGGDIIFNLGAGPGSGRDGLFFPDLPTGDPGVSGAAYIDGSGFVKISP